jgi:hypothetical protein
MRFFYYFYAWIPFIALGTIVVLVLPWLAVIALMAVLLAAVAALGSLAWGVVATLSGLRHPRKQTVPSQQVALESGVGGIATAFATAAPSIDRMPWFASADDQSERLEEAEFNPIDMYEHPDMSDTWNTSGTARRDAGR